MITSYGFKEIFKHLGDLSKVNCICQYDLCLPCGIAYQKYQLNFFQISLPNKASSVQ